MNGIIQHTKVRFISCIPYIKSTHHNIPVNNSLPVVDYLQKILTSRVYDVSIESPLQEATGNKK